MGHNIEYFSYKENVDKKKVQRDMDNYVAHADWQEGCSGLYNNIRWIDVVLNDYDEAMDYIEKHDRDNYDQLAVKYYVYPPLVKSKTYETLKERAERLRARYNELKNNIHYKDVKAKFITCRFCDSKISVTVLADRLKSYAHWGNRNECPVCGRDLRPESTIELIEKARQNAEKAEKDLRDEEKKLKAKQRKNATIKWLVKIEYHT